MFGRDGVLIDAYQHEGRMAYLEPEYLDRLASSNPILSIILEPI